MPSPGTRLSSPSIMRPTAVAPLRMHYLLAIFLTTPRQAASHARRIRSRQKLTISHCSDNHPNIAVRGKPKGAEAILREPSLWPYNSWRSDGFKLKLECPRNRGGYNPELDGTTGCCARRVFSQQQGLRDVAKKSKQS